MRRQHSYRYNHSRLIHLLQGILLILCIIFLLLCVSQIRFLDYTPDTSHESTEALANPYTGFYTMTGSMLSDTLTVPDSLASADNSTQLVMLEINLLQYRDRDISDSALSHLDTYLSDWKKSGHQLIIRFLYDWDGRGLSSEPDQIDQIITHMKQVAPIVNQYKDNIFLLQGIFVGNCGEMNQSKYLDQENMTTLMNTLASVTDPSIYLSVRTPRQRRMILNSVQVPSAGNAFDGSLSSRLGLFNDGMLGSANDTGTYGDGTHTPSEPLEAWSRLDELDYQNRLCTYVPNGGEVILENPYNDLNQALADLNTMHVSYLNKDYDTAVLDKWKQTDYAGTSGYDYISNHLGYRYALKSSLCRHLSFFDTKATITCTLENVGFSNAYRSFDVAFSVVNSRGKLIKSIPVTTDTRLWNAGEKTKLSASFDIKDDFKDDSNGKYQIYLKIQDSSLSHEILLASDAPHNEYGYRLGSFTLSRLPKRSK